ncbi:MAG: zinc ribbon domain-containing protein [Clostridiales bacterium]|nr:zinc ribbon domain-containing protein [Clostridiales bacterium]
MPIYEYICSRCGSHLEAVQKVSDPPLQECQVCGGILKKIISPPAIQFKGNGWYITDYARKPSSSKEEKSKDETKSSESPAAKSEAEAKKPSAAKD